MKYVISRLTPNRVKKTADFPGESLKFVADWLEKNNLSKLKFIFEGTFIMEPTDFLYLRPTQNADLKEALD